MQVLVIGSTGLLGKNIVKTFRNHEISICGIARRNADFNFDMTNDVALERCFMEVEPDVVINTAALINLTHCEEKHLDAYRINARAVSKVAELCEKQKCYFVQISTDHYYIGEGNKKHTEEDPVKLINEYARTKYLGECLARTYANSLIVRTNIVGLKGNSLAPTFLEWVIDCIENEKSMVLFEDFYTSTIHVRQLSEILMDLIKLRPRGILNIASSEVTSKKDFIMNFAKRMEKKPVFQTGSITSLPGVVRAESLGLDVDKAEKLLGYAMPSLDKVIDCITREYRGEFYAL